MPRFRISPQQRKILALARRRRLGVNRAQIYAALEINGAVPDAVRASVHRSLVKLVKRRLLKKHSSNKRDENRYQLTKAARAFLSV